MRSQWAWARRWWVVVPLVLVLVLVGAAAGLYAVANSRTFQFYGRLVNRVDTDAKVVALTFDDGPSELTPEVVSTLDELDVPATFYLVGAQLHDHPEYGRQLAGAGHELGNHTYSHQRMVLVSPEFVAEEVERTDREIRATGYTGEITFRPPNGKKLLALPRYLADHGRTTVTWDVEPDSTATDTAGVVRETLAQVRPGSIILLHIWYGNRQYSWRAVSEIVNALRAQGYSFVTVSQLLSRAGQPKP